MTAGVRGSSGSVWSRPLFDWFMIASVIASTVLLALASPVFTLQNPNDVKVRVTVHVAARLGPPPLH